MEEHEKQNMRALPQTIPAFLWHFMRRQKWAFALLFAATLAHVLESNVQPYALKLMVDTVTRAENPDAAYAKLAFPAALFMGTWVLMVLIWRIQERTRVGVIPKFQADIRMDVFDYVQHHSHEYFSNNFAGRIAGKIADLPRAMMNIFEFTRWRVLGAVWVALAAVVLLGTVNVQFSLILGLWVVTHMTISCLFARKVSLYSRAHAEDLNVLQGHIVDVITNIANTRLFARHAYEREFVGKSQEVERASNRRVNLAMFRARLMIDFPLMAMFAVMLYVLLHGWREGWVSPGDIVFVMFTTFNVMHLVWLLGTELPNFFSEIGVVEQAIDLVTRVHEVVDAPDAGELTVTRGEIMFDAVSFRYRKGRAIFSDKSFTIPGGQKVGLVGFSGSGKTTLVNLLLRFFDVDSGRIAIDGQDIARVTQDSLRRQIGLIPQDTSLFHRTLMENIRYGRPEASDGEVIEASKRAHCHEFISQLEEGYDSLVGERGIKLSGGQRQRIAVARAMLKAAPILILDEATSSLDSITERYIHESMAVLMKNRTTVVIAHRLSTLAGMDRILVFREGRIIEDGTHAKLLAADGHYAKLWNMQAGGFLPEAEV